MITCPICHSKFSTWRISNLYGNVGVKCGTCKTVLRSRLGIRAIVFGIVLFLGMTAAIQLGEIQASFDWTFIFIVVGVFILAEVISIQFIRFEIPKHGEKVETDLVTEMKHMDSQVAEIVRTTETTSKQKELICSNCGEKNPASFETCWKCSNEFNNGA